MAASEGWSMRGKEVGLVEEAEEIVEEKVVENLTKFSDQSAPPL